MRIPKKIYVLFTEGHFSFIKAFNMCKIPLWPCFADNIMLQSSSIWISGTRLKYLFKTSTTMFIRSLRPNSAPPSLRCFSSSALNVLKAGDVLRQTRVFSEEDVSEFSKVSYDSNPLHFDSKVARNAGFEDKLVHGMLVAALFPRIISFHFVSRTFLESFTIYLLYTFLTQIIKRII